MLLWRKEVNVIVHSYSASHIDVVIAREDGTEGWHFTGVYGHPDAARRPETWELLRHLRQYSPRPWLCAGDFNEILSKMKDRLDRACATPDWLSLFPGVSVTSERARGSDHTPLLISLSDLPNQTIGRRRKIFRFEAMWTRSKECDEIIRQMWSRPTSMVAGRSLTRKLRDVRQELSL
ncbi:UNVERIFIED_CONTAM: hypothetical protein Sradi_3191700 [Sesamum radiatum]|uniref:Endonuclease/exonuclease/phosphatase domain-containing protein n=1 Tax=Sesamum radiatum TaxID=300843 RepID=A0AAW2RF68_SESRA